MLKPSEKLISLTIKRFLTTFTKRTYRFRTQELRAVVERNVEPDLNQSLRQRKSPST